MPESLPGALPAGKVVQIPQSGSVLQVEAPTGAHFGCKAVARVLAVSGGSEAKCQNESSDER